MVDWKNRFKAAAIHLVISLLIAACAAWLVFGLWYPYPYREISGGRELFMIVVAVDVVLGPLITLAVFNRAKPRRELVQDLAMVALIQLAALSYGLWTVHAARPVHLVFEIDRFRVIHAVDVPEELLPRTPPDLLPLPMTGPTLLAVRPFASERERMDVTLAALQGLQIGARPDLWQAYEQAVPRILAAAKPVSQLKTRFPERTGEIELAVKATGRTADGLLYLPLVARKAYWTALLDARNAQVLGFVPLDSF